MDATATPRSPDESVASLVERATRGDRDAEAILCRRFTPAIRAFAARRLRSREATEEFLHDALMELLDALRGGAVQESDRIGGFVLGICRNLARERARIRDRRAHLFERYGHALTALEQDVPERCPYELAQLEDCLSQLSGRSREVVRLTYVEGELDADVALRLAVTEANLRVIRHRTLAALRDCMSTRVSWEVA